MEVYARLLIPKPPQPLHRRSLVRHCDIDETYEPVTVNVYPARVNDANAIVRANLNNILTSNGTSSPQPGAFFVTPMPSTLCSLAQGSGAEGATNETNGSTIINGVHLGANPNLLHQTEHVPATNSQPYDQAGILHAEVLPTIDSGMFSVQ